MRFYREGRTGQSFDAGIQRGLERILAAPSFIFRIQREPAQVASGSVYRLSDLDLASRLSFFLWSSVPDEELLRLAIDGKLRAPVTVEQQVRRMLRDARSQALVHGFATRWLELNKLAGVVPDTDLYPEFDENLRADMAEETRAFLGKALRPFILRRTKSQVATELPEKTEQTLYCDLQSDDRKLYDELRDYYRSRLLKRDPSGAVGQFKLQVLEALLRLRQVACHPGLVDKRRIEKGSAKLDTLLAQLDQVLEENHKVLVFSQFTSFLAIVRARLDAAEISYAYLDGRTRDREARVEQFQNDPNTKLFLISLKAGGVGLNLHAAEYVYLLDPWWNPAVEAQAIDRAHRIGQTRQVFAYRLIARDTVEEKVLELQKAKRDLADAIISADNSVIRNLTREDLELLLS